MLYIHCLIYYYDDSVCRCYINPPLTEKEARGVNLFKDIQLSTNPDLLILKTFFLTIMSCCSRQMNWYSDELSTFSSPSLWAIKIFFSVLVPTCFSSVTSCHFPHRPSTPTYGSFIFGISLPHPHILMNAMSCCFSLLNSAWIHPLFHYSSTTNLTLTPPPGATHACH